MTTTHKAAKDQERKENTMKAYPIPERIYSRTGEEYGTPTGKARSCALAGCHGLRISVTWPDGKVTLPCTDGLKAREDGYMQII